MSCSGCGRELTTRPNAICPNVIHWRAWSDVLEKHLRTLSDPAAYSDKHGGSDYDFCMFCEKPLERRSKTGPSCACAAADARKVVAKDPPAERR